MINEFFSQSAVVPPEILDWLPGYNPHAYASYFWMPNDMMYFFADPRDRLYLPRPYYCFPLQYSDQYLHMYSPWL
jgi:hypothetical protein